MRFSKNLQSLSIAVAAACGVAAGFAGLTYTASPVQAAAAAELKVGDAAPDFSLPASDGKTYKLSDFKGKQAVVIAWFPKAFTGGCTTECKSLAANGDKIRKFDVAYFMASVDPVDGPKGNKAFAESEKTDFPILGDEKKTAAAAYGVLNAKGMSNRWTIYIDKEGKIAAIDKAVKPATSAEDMIAKLKELKVAQK
ncbi:peroxiredoxin family protein [Humisphaera borealis]|uniref:Peroxiredoxin n=1 Tax=Humisphaera borealis TaxID=2807512 RepID=A0A7M2WW48_9BACT|nr:peroxiredoxin [Humisphaera borealis]QOV89715.1 peroxiredoxin [Humisphaera borealis]